MTTRLVLFLVLAVGLLFAACSDTGELEERVTALDEQLATLEMVLGAAG
jgi:hypothetical protein